jgi:membrane protease YdiL (CAAX protease family)/uncharacterized RDD family membrane protein YckC
LSDPALPTTEQAAGPDERYANVWPRLLAFLLDNAICLVVAAFVAGLIPADSYDSDLATIFALALFTAWFNYFAIAEWRWGKTIGKSALRLDVRAQEGGGPTWNAAAIRNLARLLDLVGIGPVLIATSPTRQRLGDRFAHTVVVETRRRRPAAVAPAPLPGYASAPGATTVPPNGPPPFFAPVAPPGAGPSATALLALPPPPPPPADLSALPPPAPATAGLATLPPPSAPAPGQTPVAVAAGPPAPRPEEGVGIPAPTWSIPQLLLSIPIMIGGLILVGIVIAIIDADAESPAALIAGQALLSLLLGGVALGFASQGSGALLSRDTFERLGLRRFKLSGLGLAAAAYVAYILFVAMIYSPFVQPEQQDIPQDLGVDESTLAAIAGGILIIVFAPISEEIFFRGFVYGGIRTRLGLWPAAAISAVVFGLLHISSGDLSIVPPLVIFGLLLCWLYEYTGSLGPPVVLHMINNAIAFTVITST